MNNPEVTMHEPQQSTGFIALDNAPAVTALSILTRMTALPARRRVAGGGPEGRD